jgi:hypothetical protein
MPGGEYMKQAREHGLTEQIAQFVITKTGRVARLRLVRYQNPLENNCDTFLTGRLFIHDPLVDYHLVSGVACYMSATVYYNDFSREKGLGPTADHESADKGE